MNSLDTDTLEEVFQRLVHDGEKDAALTVASMVFGSLRGTPRDWLEDNYPDGFGNKIRVIKELRAEFDLSLKDAKTKVDAFEDEYLPDEPEWVKVDDPIEKGWVGLDVRINGAEDEITDIDVDAPSLQIRTAQRGWITPGNRTWEFPAWAVR